MTAPIPEDVQRLAARLRSLADEIESAARYGVPIPLVVTANGHEYGNASFHTDEPTFDQWVDYLSQESVTTEDYKHSGKQWSKADVTINGLPLGFACVRESADQPAGASS